MQTDLTQHEMDQILYCMGVARGVLFGGITRETDEEIRDMLKTHLQELDSTTRSVMQKFSQAALA